MEGRQNVRILVVERDIFARQAIASYLSWDHNTRVVNCVGSMHEMLTNLHNNYLDVIIFDTSLSATPAQLEDALGTLALRAPDAQVICLTHRADPEMALVARERGACAYWLREAVGIGIASAVRYALRHDFVITQDGLAGLVEYLQGNIFQIEVLPQLRRYPRLTQRIEQALWLCVIEGLPAERAAEEMGVSVSTVRSYIKEGYRILEDADDTNYPSKMSPAERAFLRYSALEMSTASASWEPAA